MSWQLALVLVLVVLAVRPLVGIVRFASSSRDTRRHYPAAWRACWRWRWLTRNLGLAYLDQHKRATRPVPFGTSVKVNAELAPSRLRYPRARFRADDYGLVARVRTVPRTGRAEFEANVDYIADAWRCCRVQVSQQKPGRLLVRGLRRDPLAESYPMDAAPAGTYGQIAETSPEIQRLHNVQRLYVGRDEWAEHRYIRLAGLTGITVAGLPGYGKSSLAWSWLCQLSARVDVQFVILDGKGSADYSDWADRAWLFAGDDLAEGLGALTQAVALMRARHAVVLERTGYRNAWHAGPSEAWPLVVVLIDECQQYLDVAQYKGDSGSEAMARRCAAAVGQLVRKGRSVLMLTVLLTQKPTADSLPTSIRDNSAVGLSFALRTRDAAVAALGDGIREFSSYCPTGLRDLPPGVATTTLATGRDPFTRLRVPEVTESAAAERAFQNAFLKRDPFRGLAEASPSLQLVTA